MACFLTNRHNTMVIIPNVEKTDNVILYQIKIKVGDVSWTVLHRYSDFADLHEKLVSDHGVTKDILPPKKVIGNRDPAFIEKRRAALETYMALVVNFLQMAMPRELALFLDFHHYDILFLLQSMAMRFFVEGDSLLQTSKSYTFNPLELYAISERLKQPCPSLEVIDKRCDFSHVLDFCCQLTTITIKGSSTPIGTSNIVPNKLCFELSVFKVVECLNLINLPASNIYNLGAMRSTVTTLNVHESHLKGTACILLCDEIHKDVTYSGVSDSWRKIVEADFSHNSLEAIDEGVKLMPNLQKLTLSCNKISALRNLTSLPHLFHLSLSENYFSEASELHTKLGNIRFIDLSQNSITSLQGFSKLYSLEALDLASNQISELNEIRYISSLPCLENLILTGNPVAIVVDYRVRVLEQFGNRVSEICLDNEKPSQKELDTVAVLQAIRIVKEGRTPTFGPEAPTFP